MANFVNNLVQRRVPHYMALYLGFAWGTVQFTAFLVDEFLLSPHLTRVALTVVVALLPSVLIVTYLHGRKGKDRWGRVEKISIPLNVLVTIALLFYFFADQDLGAATSKVTVETDDGETVERQVAKAAFRQRTVLFPFDTVGDDDAEWMGFVLPDAVVFDLGDSTFFDPVHYGFLVNRLRRTGHDDVLNIPLALKIEASDEHHATKMFSGTIEVLEDSLVVTSQLHNVESGELLAERIFSGDDLLALIDDAAVQLEEDLEMPGSSGVNLPLSERLTSNPEALASFGRGIRSLVGTPDWPQAIEQFQAATVADPTFAAAQHRLASALLYSNRAAEAAAPIQAALDNLYRLPERSQFLIKSDHYFLTQQADKAWAVIDMWAELYPDDLAALNNLILVRRIRGDIEGAIAAMRHLYDLNPSAADILKQIASLNEERGDYEAAREDLETYLSLFPNDASGLLASANLARRSGRFDDARETLERAILLEPADGSLVRALAEVERDLGNYEGALAQLERALAIAKTAEDHAAYWEGVSIIHQSRGQLEAACDAAVERSRYLAQFQPPVLALRQRVPQIRLLVKAGRRAEAERLVANMVEAFAPPTDVMAKVAELEMAVALDDAEAAAEVFDALTEEARSRFPNIRPALYVSEGRVAELGSDWEAAFAAYSKVLDQTPENVVALLGVARSLRELGRTDQAETQIARILKRLPTQPAANLELARLRTLSGDREEAKAALSISLAAWEQASSSFEPAAEARELGRELGITTTQSSASASP